MKSTKPKGKSGAGQTLGGVGTTGGASASPSNIDSKGSREAMLSAAEKRRLQVRRVTSFEAGMNLFIYFCCNQAENRGAKDGGKLSKQLADEKKQKNQPLPKNDVDDRLVVSLL